MATNKNISNKDLLKEIKAINGNIVNHHERIKSLEAWKIATDAAETAIAKYKLDHPRRNGNGITLPKEVIKILGYLAGAIAVLVGAGKLVQ